VWQYNLSLSQKRPSEGNRNDTQMSGVYLYIKEESDIERNSSRELHDVHNGRAKEEDHYTNPDAAEK
jgi:hypothetical protein